MAFYYVGGDRDQMFLLATSMRDWLDEGHLAWFVIDVVETVDTSQFHARHRNDGAGRAAYHPDMMLALLFYAYGVGMRSSRRIEAACRTDAAFRVICGNVFPDHATIARFLVNHEQAIEGLFVEVLRLCAAAGLVSLGTIALDGTKIGTDASLDSNRTAGWIRAEASRIIGEALSVDAAEYSGVKPLFDSEELPSALTTRVGRLARLDAALASIRASEEVERDGLAKLAVRAAAASEVGRQLEGRKHRDPRAALLRAEMDAKAIKVRGERKRAARVELEAAATETGRKVLGRKPKLDDRDELAAAKKVTDAARRALAVAGEAHRANIVDPDSRIMKTQKGWVQGYNAQAVVNELQVVVGHNVTQEGNDKRQFAPMMAVTRRLLDLAGITVPVEMVLADAGYWSDANATVEGPDRLIATTKDHVQRRVARQMGTTVGPPNPDMSHIDAMEHRLRTPQGAARYSMRSHTIEPLFGDLKENRGFRRFRRRGLNAARSEWALMTLSHNLAKLFDHQTIITT